MYDIVTYWHPVFGFGDAYIRPDPVTNHLQIDFDNLDATVYLPQDELVRCYTIFDK